MSRHLRKATNAVEEAKRNLAVQISVRRSINVEKLVEAIDKLVEARIEERDASAARELHDD